MRRDDSHRFEGLVSFGGWLFGFRVFADLMIVVVEVGPLALLWRLYDYAFFTSHVQQRENNHNKGRQDPHISPL